MVQIRCNWRQHTHPCDGSCRVWHISAILHPPGSRLGAFGRVVVRSWAVAVQSQLSRAPCGRLCGLCGQVLVTPTDGISPYSPDKNRLSNSRRHRRWTRTHVIIKEITVSRRLRQQNTNTRRLPPTKTRAI